MTSPNATQRGALVRRGLWLNYATIAYNSLEAVVSLVAGVMAGSVALVGFGIDSVIEVTASAAAQWRLRADIDRARRERAERVTLRVIGGRSSPSPRTWWSTVRRRSGSVSGPSVR